VTDETTSSPDRNLADHRKCLACGYDLHGLGDGPHCPECGLLNIPQGYRQQVWDLVDSGKWFFSGFLHPFKKRLPGWWWALDRDGDLQKSYKFAAKKFAIASLILLVSCYFANACVVKEIRHVTARDKSDPTATMVEVAKVIMLHGLAMRRSEEVEQVGYSQTRRFQRLSWRRSTQLVYAPTWHALLYAIGFISWLILQWGFPTFVGLITQLRKGLPEFARPQRTVIAACMYESHRMVYSAIVIALLLSVEVASRYSAICTSFGMTHYMSALRLIVVSIISFGAVSWIGPLRSDYTKQLVRSRSHATRIIIMYSALLPAVFIFACLSLKFGILIFAFLRMM